MDKLERITNAIDDWTKDRPALKKTDTVEVLISYIIQEVDELTLAYSDVINGMEMCYLIEEIADVLIFSI